MVVRDKFNYLLITLMAILLTTWSFFGVIRNNFSDITSFTFFMQQAKAYEHLSDLIKIKIQERYPEEFSQQIVRRVIADRLLDFVITPELVARVNDRLLKVSVRVAQAPTELINDKVVLETEGYKKQFSERLASFELPPVVEDTANRLIAATPDQLVLVDTKERPNSILALIIRMREMLEKSILFHNISRIGALILFLTLLIYNGRRLKSFFYSAMWAFGIGAGLVFLMSLVAVPIISQFLPAATTQAMVTQNTLITDALTYLFKELWNFVLLWGGLAIIFGLCWYYVSFARVQPWIDTNIYKVKPPVKVRPPAPAKKKKKK